MFGIDGKMIAAQQRVERLIEGEHQPRFVLCLVVYDADINDVK